MLPTKLGNPLTNFTAKQDWWFVFQYRGGDEGLFVFYYGLWLPLLLLTYFFKVFPKLSQNELEQKCMHFILSSNPQILFCSAAYSLKETPVNKYWGNSRTLWYFPDQMRSAGPPSWSLLPLSSCSLWGIV